jgi:hypothetical protein
MASWASAQRQPSAMVQARWVIRWWPWHSPLVGVHDSLLPGQTIRAQFSTTRRWSVGVVETLVSLVMAQSPTSVIRVWQLLQQHLQSTLVLAALHLQSARVMHTHAQFSTTQRSSVGVLAAMVVWVLVQPPTWVTVQARWAFRLALLTWVRVALLAQSVRVLRTRVRCWIT